MSAKVTERERRLKIFTSNLTIPARYYAASAYKERGPGQVEITGKKWDVTDDIRSIATEVSEPYREMLRSLTNEVSGLLGIIEQEIRHAAGNTNVNVLKRKIEEAKALLEER